MDFVEAFDEASSAILARDPYRDVEVVVRTARRANGGFELRLMLDRPDGIDLAVCGEVAHAINEALRDFPDRYTLSVESAGLDRPLVRPEDYDRFRGHEAVIKTRELLDNAKTHRGRLEGLREGSAILVDERGREIVIPLDAIERASLEFDVREVLRKHKRAAGTEKVKHS